MGRSEQPVDPLAGPVERLAWELRQIRNRAGRPSQRELAERAHFSRSALAEAAAGTRLPGLEVTLAYAAACGGDPPIGSDGGTKRHWRPRGRGGTRARSLPAPTTPI